MPTCFTRTLIWKSCLITDTLKINNWGSKLYDQRVIFHQLVNRKDMKVPWEKLEHDSIYFKSDDVIRKPSMIKSKNKSLKNSLNRVHTNEDPLSGNTEHHQEDEDIELLQNPICIFKLNGSYKQGYHETLALIFINLRNESVQIPQTNTFSEDDLKILSLYDMRYLSHDAFSIFNKFMSQSGVITNFYESEQSLWKSIEKFNMYLMKIDQFIHYTLQTKLKLESQLWIIRYLRMLLLRELGDDLETTILLWDKLVATQVSSTHSGSNLAAIPDLLNFMIIQLLLQKKTDIISSDFSECLSLLLHYPINFKTPIARNEFVKRLYKDAIKLYERRHDDLKLYEYGIRLNNRYNPNLRVLLNYTGGDRSSSESVNSSRAASPAPSIKQQHPQQHSAALPNNTRSESSKFEKTRLEMRLKKKVQSMINNPQK
ncbi:Tbc1d5 TBC1 domain family member 5 [Candida maltosa Xu316]